MEFGKLRITNVHAYDPSTDDDTPTLNYNLNAMVPVDAIEKIIHYMQGINNVTVTGRYSLHFDIGCMFDRLEVITNIQKAFVEAGFEVALEN